MQKFDFHVSKEFLTFPFETPIYLTVEYFLQDTKVILYNIGIPPPILPYLKDMYKLHNEVYHAAKNNATNDTDNVDFMVKIFDHFKTPAL